MAENITGRFINVLSLFAGTVPLIAIQLSTLKVGEQIVLNFVRVLDRFGLRTDDEVDVPGVQTTREDWDRRAAPATVALTERFLAVINKASKTRLQLNFLKHYIGLSDGNRSRNFVYFVPRKQHVYIYASVADAQGLSQRLQDDGWEAGVDKYNGYVRLLVRPKELEERDEGVRELLEAAARNFDAE